MPVYVIVAVEFKLLVEQVPPFVVASNVTVLVAVPLLRVALDVATLPFVVELDH